MRTRLFLSVAVATLSLSLSQGYAQQAGREPMGGDASKQGESTRMQKPGEQGAAEQRRERRSEQKQDQERSAAEQPGKPDQGAAARDDDKRSTGAASKEDDKRAAGKEDDKGAAAKRHDKQAADKDEDKQSARKGKQGAMSEDRDRTPAAQGRRDMDRQEKTGRAGERTGAATTDAERRATQTETDKAGRAGERTGAAATDAERRATQAERDRAGRAGERTGAAATDAERRATQAETDRAGRAGRMEQRGDVERGREAFDRSTGDASREARGGGRLQLSQRENSRVRQTLLAQRDVQRISPNVFNPTIGAVLPPNVQFYPLPAGVISMVPQFRGYNYVMVGDDIAIIDPGTREVVTVLDEGGPGAAYGYGYGDEDRFRGYGYERRGRSYGSARRDDSYRSARRDNDGNDDDDRVGARRRGEAYGYAPRVRLDTRQERALYRGIMSESRSNLRQVCVRVGERVPESVDIEPVPRSIAAEAPDAERFEYFVLNDQVVLVDPDTRIVVDIIEQPR